jgi:hypothetical protein
MLLVQGLVLVAWHLGWTVTAAHDAYPFQVGRRVFDPHVESAYMTAMWCAAFMTLGGAILWGVIRVSASAAPLPRGRAVATVIVLLVESMILLSMSGNMNVFRRSVEDAGIPPVRSPDGLIEAQAVPMSHWFDGEAAVVLCRRSGDFWWRSVAVTGEGPYQVDQAQLKWMDAHDHVRMDFGNGSMDFDVRPALDSGDAR